MCTSSSSIPLYSPTQAQKPTALALGSFDGVHAGHRQVIKAISGNTTAVPTVVSFWPHPREVLFGESRLRLYLPSEQTNVLAPLGVKQLVLIPFNHALASLSAEEFVNTMLIDTLQARHISVGENFRFGKGREADAYQLQKLAGGSGVEVSVIPILKDKDGRMSSSRIRAALEAGGLEAAKKLMGRAYRFSGKVVKGKGIGRRLGWPTANLNIDGRKFLPGLGVYAAWAWLKGQSPYCAIMNLGPQPTVDPTSPSAVEVHILDQELSIEGQELTVEPVMRLRGQKRFSSLEVLSNQIKKDAELARELLSNIKRPLHGDSE